MSSEEEKEELKLYKKYAQNSMFGIFGSFFDQISIYKWMLEASMRFGNVPNTIITTSRRRTSARSVMDEVMEFNRCMDLKSEDYNEEDWKEENIVAQFKIDELHENKTIEITLEELEKELSDGKEGDTDSIWYSEAMQNPCPSQEEIEKAGDGPLEVGRQMNEAIGRTMNIFRRNGETDEEFRRRLLSSGSYTRPSLDYENQNGSRIRGTPNRTRGCVGSVFLAHQREQQCMRCERVGCPNDRIEEANRGNYCEGFVNKKRLEIKEIKCTVCEMVLDEPENFPSGFPNKWKICCYCSEVWARFNGFRGEDDIHIGFNWAELKERWERFGKKFKEVFEL